MPPITLLWTIDLPTLEVAEELPNDTIATNVATLITGELSRNRHGRAQVAVSVFNERGKSFTRFPPALSTTLGGGRHPQQLSREF